VTRPPPVAIGIDDFRTLRELGLEYVDKSDLIRQVLDRAGVQAILLPRPRRFGKSLNGLNNLGVYSLLATSFNTCFGFTEAEVATLLARAGQSARLDDVRTWYNGYLFGGAVVYNPWSVLNFLDSGDDRPQPYWLSTSSNDLLHEMLARYALRIQPAFETLLEGGVIERPLDENVTLSESREDDDALWSLLVFSGYLKAGKGPSDAFGAPTYRLSIPNREVRQVYATTFWGSQGCGGDGGGVRREGGEGEGGVRPDRVNTPHAPSSTRPCCS
jgi:hypothetical protein